MNVYYTLLDYKYRQIIFKNELEQKFLDSITINEVLVKISKKYYKKDMILNAFLSNGIFLPQNENLFKILNKLGYNPDFYIFIIPQKFSNILISIIKSKQMFMNTNIK